MTNISKDVRPFDLQLAIASHPLTTRAGDAVKFIAHVPENEEFYRVIVCVAGKPEPTDETGKYCGHESDFDLFLAPLGYCEGLPVFAGDILYSLENEGEWTVDVSYNSRVNVSFNACKWPSKIPVIKTRMTEQECYNLYHKGPDLNTDFQYLANKAIERAIMDGDVMPTGLFLKLAGIAYNERINSGNKSFTEIAEHVLKDYLETLK